MSEYLVRITLKFIYIEYQLSDNVSLILKKLYIWSDPNLSLMLFNVKCHFKIPEKFKPGCYLKKIIHLSSHFIMTFRSNAWYKGFHISVSSIDYIKLRFNGINKSSKSHHNSIINLSNLFSFALNFMIKLYDLILFISILSIVQKRKTQVMNA